MLYANIEAQYNEKTNGLKITNSGVIIYQKDDCCHVVDNDLIWDDINDFYAVVGKSVRRELSNYTV
jgi:hypothetical protein